MRNMFLFLAVVSALAAASAAQAANQGDVVINEIAWMGNTSSASGEWMELKNTTNRDIYLAGWKITSADGKLTINLTGAIYKNGFYLMERSNDNAVPGITANVIYSGALNNNGEDLKLYDNLDNVIDEVNFPAKWPAGNNTTKQTMEKTATGWQTSQDPNGTPDAPNSQGAIAGPDNSTTTAQNPPTNITYPSGVIINEILPNPLGPDATNEWIELYNTNPTNVDMSGWQLQDTQGTTATYTFAPNSVIKGNGYLVLKRPDTKIMLNNDGDGLNLMFPDATIANTMSFANAPLNQSYNYTASGWQWSTTLTADSANIITASAPKPKTSVKKSNSAKNILSNAPKTDNTQLSAANEPAALAANAAIKTTGSAKIDTSNPLWLFFIVLGMMIILGIIIFLLNLKFNIFKKTNT